MRDYSELLAERRYRESLGDSDVKHSECKAAARRRKQEERRMAKHAAYLERQAAKEQK